MHQSWSHAETRRLGPYGPHSHVAVLVYSSHPSGWEDVTCRQLCLARAMLQRKVQPAPTAPSGWVHHSGEGDLASSPPVSAVVVTAKNIYPYNYIHVYVCVCMYACVTAYEPNQTYPEALLSVPWLFSPPVVDTPRTQVQ